MQGGRSDQMWEDQESHFTAPDEAPLMFQSWAHLSLLHWKVDADQIQKLLPPELIVDTFDGDAYVGLVPFTMHDIRMRNLPKIPTAHRFHETNVRTYVHHNGRQPGVWFFSLDAQSRLAVAGARFMFGLPYHFSRMELAQQGEGWRYQMTRVSDQATSEVSTTFDQPFEVAKPRSLESFLIDRYLLYSKRRGELVTGRVWHPRYQICAATAKDVSDELVRLAGFEVNSAPDLVHFSPGFDVKCYRPTVISTADPEFAGTSRP